MPLPSPALTLIAMAASVWLAGCSAVANPTATERADIVAKARAIDGDTYSIDLRLSGVDAPERRQECQNDRGCYPCGKLAQDRAAKLLRGKQAEVLLTGDTTYGRPVAVVRVAGRDVGEVLIRDGHAVPALRYLRSESDRGRRYSEAHAEALAARRGVHAGPWVQPERWRRGDRLACER